MRALSAYQCFSLALQSHPRLLFSFWITTLQSAVQYHGFSWWSILPCSRRSWDCFSFDDCETHDRKTRGQIFTQWWIIIIWQHHSVGYLFSENPWIILRIRLSVRLCAFGSMRHLTDWKMCLCECHVMEVRHMQVHSKSCLLNGIANRSSIWGRIEVKEQATVRRSTKQHKLGEASSINQKTKTKSRVESQHEGTSGNIWYGI